MDAGSYQAPGLGFFQNDQIHPESHPIPTLEMFRWYSTRKRNSAPGTQLDIMEDDTTDHVSTEPEPEPESVYPSRSVDRELQHPAETVFFDAPSDERAICAPPYDDPPTPSNRRSPSPLSESTLTASSPGGQGGKVMLWEPPRNPVERRPSFEPAERPSEERVQDNTMPQDRPTQDNAIPVYLGSRPKNVILFGETGVGKSSVINLMAGKEIAKTSANLKGCTLEATEYWFGLSEDMSLRIFDTVGLEEPEIGVNSFMGAIEKAHKLVQSLHASGGIDLLLFCIRGGRITAAMQRSYRLFYEILCGGQVPLAIVVTNLEREDVMESWWVKNESTFQEYGIRPAAHACITAVPAHITMYAQKRAESQRTLRKMLQDALNSTKPPYVRDVRSWFVAIVRLLRSFMAKSESLKKKDLMKRLEKRCMLSRHDAERLALMLTGGGLLDTVLAQQACTDT